MKVQRLALNCGVVAGLALALFGRPEAAQGKTLYSFSGPDGSYPSEVDVPWAAAGDIIRDGDGNIYGTTENGGAAGQGVVFKLAPDGTETVLHSFNGNDGLEPSGLRRDQTTGDLYGVTLSGGNLDDCGRGSSGCGVIYKLTPDGTETILHRFTQNDYFWPVGLKRDSAGNLYGIARRSSRQDGHHFCGAIYEVTADGTFNILHEFKLNRPALGCTPNSRLVTDKQGNLYGTTESGGSGGFGIVFRLAQDGTYTVLHDFGAYKDGQLPWGLVKDDTGNIYGTTIWGGNGKGTSGAGVLFKLTADGKFTVLHVFSGRGSDGGGPGGDLVSTSDGMVYGTTGYGGDASQCSDNGCGTIFSVAPDGSFTTVYTFRKRSAGYGPNALLIDKGEPNIYGTTVAGGAFKCCGTVFKVRR